MAKTKQPLYIKVLTYLTELIEQEYRAGQLIPTQTAIAKATDTSLITVKRAISHLVNEGILETIAGKGTFVKEKPLMDNHVGVSSWTDSISSIGKKPETLLVEVEKTKPSAKVANLLRIKSRGYTISVNRVRGIDGKAICLMHNELPFDLVPDLKAENLNQESLYQWIQQKYGHVPAIAEEEVYARAATEEERSLFELKTDIVLVIKRVSYLLDKRPFEYSKIIAPATEYRYKSKQINPSVAELDFA
ncbi:GntR family transcriptional regulator [Persicobacter psychrovividus]|uniref:GntR family transcriptional regulator n=1 Tax=Persicobacter psychrovividus TaxID=387638 RepID=A0ABM7VJP3_9BACT|nr:GntR family transcriptional regulator [Persicobacter psychrovividus]